MKEEHHKNSSVEGLFICAQSASPNSVLLLDPFSAATRWSLRSSEFQQGKLQTAEPIGSFPSFLCVALAEKPIVHVIPLARQAKKDCAQSPRFAGVKSVLAHTARFIQTHPCGDFIFVSAENKLFSWEIHSGQLLSLVEGHLREISAMRISSCGHFLVTASLDGDVKVFMTANLIAERDSSDLSSADRSALVAYSPHSLPIDDLFLSGGAHSVSSLRILTVSADHSAALYSLCSNQILLRVTADRPLTACCLDPAELRVFLAAESGAICSLDICTQFRDQFVPFSGHNSSASPSLRRFDHQHTVSVSKLSVSADGTRMASGDRKGVYCIWDTTNGQCLLSGTMQGPISALSFRRHWTTIDELPTDADIGSQIPSVAMLQRNLSGKQNLKMMIGQWAVEAKGAAEKTIDETLGALVRRINSGQRIVTPWHDGSSANDANKSLRKKDDAKRRRISTTKSPTGIALSECNDSEIISPLNNGQGMNEREMMLTEQVRCLQRELARVVQLNAELYNYSTNMALEGVCTENTRRSNS